MKKLLMLSFAATLLMFTACSDNNSEDTAGTDDSTSLTTTEMSTAGTGASDAYIDLKTGSTVTKDEASGRYVDASGNPVDFYVDVNTRDTIYASTGQNVNNAVIYDNGEWRVDEGKVKIDGDEMKYKNGDTKVKVDGDEYKSKSGDTKVKVDGDESKVKTDD
jgi:hypothetical protein